MSTTLLSATTLPVLAKLVSKVGLGAAARSGGLPAATRVVRSASWSRLASYWIVIPVESVTCFITAMNEACSAPVQVAMTLTDPAFVDELVPHATAVRMAASERIRLLFNHNWCILKSPSNAGLTASLPRYDTFYVPLLIFVIRELVGALRAAVAHLLAQGTRGGRSDHQTGPERRDRKSTRLNSSHT